MLLWWMAGELDQLSQAAADALESAPVVISAVSAWEIAIKRRLGKLDAPADLMDQLARAGLEPLAISGRHADRVGELPLHHRDPFDRLLISQAQLEELALVSADEPVRSYDIDVIW